IACRTTIGYGAPGKAGSEKCHGSPLGTAEIAGARESLGWTSPPFEIPADIRALWRNAAQRCVPQHRAWRERLNGLGQGRRAEFERRIAGEVDCDKLETATRFVKEKLAAAPKEIATRAASELALES